jgi:hypothetical protein
MANTITDSATYRYRYIWPLMEMACDNAEGKADFTRGEVDLKCFNSCKADAVIKLGDLEVGIIESSGEFRQVSKKYCWAKQGTFTN